MNTAELHTLTGAYAVHALPDDERAEFERHLADCDQCAQEVRELCATAERLGAASAFVAPPRMRTQVLRRISAVRQEPPRLPATDGISGPLRARALPRFVLAACLAAAAGLGGIAVWQHQEAQDARERATVAEQRAQGIARVLASPDARRVTGRLADGATGTVVVSERRDKAAFLASGLPAAPSGKVYQLWFDDHGTMRSAGILDGSSGDASMLMEGRVGGATGMGITVEPSGGSKQPTSDPLALMEFPA
ncbi:anti-sigma factor [Streptomyces meridianus]|uniref:Regulator of SigK n=1 Tax=Streptomyces meridianus TaxID=2938945 RepID=A0ABT0XD61_9ACTN|nr:anti-sigma factor [Streptomyces meridianus]MCM2580215.1 anti-sigma factor [Streptomyces meridianus]